MGVLFFFHKISIGKWVSLFSSFFLLKGGQNRRSKQDIHKISIGKWVSFFPFSLLFPLFLPFFSYSWDAFGAKQGKTGRKTGHP